MDEQIQSKVPGWFWIAAVLALLWECIGCFMYVTQVTTDPASPADRPRGDVGGDSAVDCRCLCGRRVGRACRRRASADAAQAGRAAAFALIAGGGGAVRRRARGSGAAPGSRRTAHTPSRSRFSSSATASGCWRGGRGSRAGCTREKGRGLVPLGSAGGQTPNSARSLLRLLRRASSCPWWFRRLARAHRRGRVVRSWPRSSRPHPCLAGTAAVAGSAGVAWSCGGAGGRIGGSGRRRRVAGFGRGRGVGVRFGRLGDRRGRDKSDRACGRQHHAL